MRPKASFYQNGHGFGPPTKCRKPESSRLAFCTGPSQPTQFQLRLAAVCWVLIMMVLFTTITMARTSHQTPALRCPSLSCTMSAVSTNAMRRLSAFDVGHSLLRNVALAQEARRFRRHPRCSLAETQQGSGPFFSWSNRHSQCL